MRLFKLFIGLSLFFGSLNYVQASEDTNKTDKTELEERVANLRKLAEFERKVAENNKKIEELDKFIQAIDEVGNTAIVIQQPAPVETSLIKKTIENLASSLKTPASIIAITYCLKTSYDLYKLMKDKPNPKYKITTIYYLKKRNILLKKICICLTALLLLQKGKACMNFVIFIGSKLNITSTAKLNELVQNLAPAITIVLTKWKIDKSLTGDIQFNFSPTISSTKFTDVAGATVAKNELLLIVDFIKNPLKYEIPGAKLPRGILLVGEPGNGKTLLAKATAGEASCYFFGVSGTEFTKSYLGQGRQAVKSLFEKARKNIPAIIFFDEFDSLAADRNGQNTHSEKATTLNELLVQMDGIDSDQYPIAVIAATNNYDMLDKAAIRSGRFDKTIKVSACDNTWDKLAILKTHLKQINLEEGTDLTSIASDARHFTGADLANLVNQAALIAAKSNREKVTLDHFKQALEDMKKLKRDLAQTSFSSSSL
ncbi:MAG: AAA family ATPase [Candidatus Babeliales bacterium]|nr:AAA family ATPase [Candidatus Babeliales bacterium]